MQVVVGVYITMLAIVINDKLYIHWNSISTCCI